MKMILFFSHTLSVEQVRDATQNLGVSEFISMPEILQAKFSQVPADLENLESYASEFFEFIKSVAKKGDFALVQGDFGLSFLIVNFCFKSGIIPVYATTKRDVLTSEDGIKKSVFKHVKFRRYSKG